MPKRELLVLTRSKGVRPENPLFRALGEDKDKYWPLSVATPELREEADKLLEDEKPKRKLGLTVKSK